MKGIKLILIIGLLFSKNIYCFKLMRETLFIVKNIFPVIKNLLNDINRNNPIGLSFCRNLCIDFQKNLKENNFKEIIYNKENKTYIFKNPTLSYKIKFFENGDINISKYEKILYKNIPSTKETSYIGPNLTQIKIENIA
jgi:hypothetical protein